MTGVIDMAMARSRTILSVLVLILVTGAYAYAVIPKESDPDIDIPIIYVVMTHEGISPEDAERLLIRPMEQKLRTIEGIKEMRSTGFEGGANVLMEFDAGFDADQAAADVREKVDQAKSELPAETEDPTVNEINVGLFPVLTVMLSGDVPERALYRLADDLKDRIEGLSNVLKADISGDRDDVVEVVVDPVVVESYGMVPSVTTDAVRSFNLLVAAGTQDTGRGRFSVKVPGLLEDMRDIMSLPVKVNGDAVVRIMDLAEVRRGFRDPQSFARIDGQPSVALEVSKRTGRNIIETIAQIREVVEKDRAQWPDELKYSVKVDYLQDKSQDIKMALTDLQNSVLAAIILVMIIIVGALGWRTGGLVGVAIPGSFLTAILVLFISNITINIVVLFSLILAVGMLVDGAIVVTEYADRKMSEGLHRKEAYSLAARRMASPIIASTATTLAAFLPLAFWPNVIGEFMMYLPLTVLIVLSASLVMALIFVPTIGGLIGKPGSMDPKTLRAVSAGETGSLDKIGGLTGLYLKVLGVVLRAPKTVIMVAVGTLIGVINLYGEYGKGVEFFPDIDTRHLVVQVHARGNLSIHEKDALVRQVEKRLLGRPEVETVYARTGIKQMQEQAPDTIGTIYLELKDWQHRRPANTIIAELRQDLSDFPGIYVDVDKQKEGPPTGKPINIQLSSDHIELLNPAVATIRQGMDGIAGLTNIEDTRPLPGIDFELAVDRSKSAKFGASVASIGNTIRMATVGYKVGSYRPDDNDDEIDIVVRFPTVARTVDDLDTVRVQTSQGAVPISNLVTRSAKPSVGEIKRVDGKRTLTIKADVSKEYLADDKLKEVQAWITAANLDPRVDIAFKGENQDQKDSEAFLGKAFLVALFIMAIILVTQFNSFYSVLLILSAVIMSTIGVLIGLMITEQPFGVVMCGVGVISLAGIVVNNNIVLIDTHNRLRRDIKDAREAIMRTGAQRLRPVLLTTVTTILGLLPMMFRMNIDFITREVTFNAPSTQWWAQLATAIVFGLAFSTVLTLLVTPAALMAKANFGAWVDRIARRLRERKMRKAAQKAQALPAE